MRWWIIVSLVSGCTASTHGIPCTTSSNCPSGMLCDPLVNECYSVREATAPDHGTDRRDASRLEARDSTVDRPRIDAPRPDTLRADVLRPDTLRPDQTTPPDSFASCAATCAALDCVDTTGAAWCGGGCYAAMAGCSGQCTSDAQCCQGLCISGQCFSTKGGMCWGVTGVTPSDQWGCAPGLTCVGAVECPGGSGCACGGKTSTEAWGTCE